MTAIFFFSSGIFCLFVAGVVLSLQPKWGRVRLTHPLWLISPPLAKLFNRMSQRPESNTIVQTLRSLDARGNSHFLNVHDFMIKVLGAQNLSEKDQTSRGYWIGTSFYCFAHAGIILLGLLS